MSAGVAHRSAAGKGEAGTQSRVTRSNRRAYRVAMPVREDDPYDANKLRRSIEAALDRRNIARAKAGKKMGVGDRTISKFLEGGTTSPTVASLVRLGAAIDASIGELCGEVSPARETSESESMLEQLVASQREQIQSLLRQIDLLQGLQAKR